MAFEKVANPNWTGKPKKPDKKRFFDATLDKDCQLVFNQEIMTAAHLMNHDDSAVAVTGAQIFYDEDKKRVKILFDLVKVKDGYDFKTKKRKSGDTELLYGFISLKNFFRVKKIEFPESAIKVLCTVEQMHSIIVDFSKLKPTNAFAWEVENYYVVKEKDSGLFLSKNKMDFVDDVGQALFFKSQEETDKIINNNLPSECKKGKLVNDTIYEDALKNDVVIDMEEFDNMEDNIAFNKGIFIND